MNDSTEIWRAYWTRFAEAFAYHLKAGGLLSEFVTNTAVTGAYAEAWIRSLVVSMLPQFRVSTGAIIRPMDKIRNRRSIPQCDVIIWDPSELPALFEQGDFALVPFHSARAVIEIKRTCSGLHKLQGQLRRQQRCLKHEIRSNVLGVVVSHADPLFTGEVASDWLEQDGWEDSPAMTRLLSADPEEIDVDGVFVLIYFLAQVAGHKSRIG
jgi:hypothetical protein